MLQSVRLNVEKMKIGILTLPLHTNYGGILQAYALQTILERMGHEVKVIKVDGKGLRRSMLQRILSILKRSIKRYLFHKNIVINYEKYERELTRISRRFTDMFIVNHIKVFNASRFTDIKDYDFEAYVVGSDQIWRKKYFVMQTSASIDNSYLSFTKGWNVKRIAYAPSFGTDDWEYTLKETIACRESLQKFDAVSIREIGGIYLCKEYFQVNAVNVLDPTMLLHTSDYEQLIKQHNIPKNIGNLHQYILDMTPLKRQLVEMVAHEKGLRPFSIQINQEKGIDLHPEQLIQPPVEQWLAAFYGAEYIVTDSFHACVFSILFRKQFVVVGNIDRGMSRFNSLLSQFGLEDRLVENVAQYRSLTNINYDAVYQKLEEKRRLSFNFLIKALKDTENVKG